MSNPFPERPIIIYPSLAASIGLEEATMLAILDDLTRNLERHKQENYQWFQLAGDTLRANMPFWDSLDIERISQRLRDQGLILLRSAPFNQSHAFDFAFNQQASQATLNAPHKTQKPQRHISKGASAIAANWQPDQETLIGLRQLNIPEHFAREQVPEFVRYWRESGESQRSWGSKFIQHVKRQWTFHTTYMARKNKASTLAQNWEPSAELQSQIANEGIPATFASKILKKFRLYHQSSGTTHINWDMPFFSWVKEEWRKQDTPFIETRQSRPMSVDWRPDQHTLDYLNVSYGIDQRFVEESIPEFTHKWIEKKAVYTEWGRIFAEHVIEQWRFVQLGINLNTERKLIQKNWRPSGDCLEILQNQSGVDPNFIQRQIPEFILYWTNRGEPMHSWDNIFLRHIKQEWAKTHQGIANERQQNYSGSTRTKDRSLRDELTDTSWAN